MQIAYIGNFEPTHSTENHVARALKYNGHDVARVQEDGDRQWEVSLAQLKLGTGADFILWTRTGWDYTSRDHGAYASREEALMLQLQFLMQARKMGVPTVAYHLDLFHGLNPERVAVLDEPFFQCDLVITADGGHEEDFKARGINHVWFPPGVSLAECERGMFRDEFRSPIAFVGNWAGEYHPESRHRFELVKWLQEHYMRDCAFWPHKGHHAIRGADLRDLYASVDVVVGDSCFAGQIADYWSDRIPETLGRGGFLIHPNVPGLEGQFSTARDPLDLLIWEAGHWDGLQHQIEWALANPKERREVAAHGRQTVMEKHTYERRMDDLITLMRIRDLLPPIKKASPRKKAPK